jgi:hypothetical protein
MRGRRHDDYYRIGRVEEAIERRMRHHAELIRDLPCSLLADLDESAQLDARKLAQNPYMVEPEAARADHANAWGISQITTPRSLASTNRRSSFTSGSGSSSVCACSIA